MLLKLAVLLACLAAASATSAQAAADGPSADPSPPRSRSKPVEPDPPYAEEPPASGRGPHRQRYDPPGYEDSYGPAGPAPSPPRDRWDRRYPATNDYDPLSLMMSERNAYRRVRAGMYPYGMGSPLMASPLMASLMMEQDPWSLLE